jgi:hypothetical protein
MTSMVFSALRIVILARKYTRRGPNKTNYLHVAVAQKVVILARKTRILLACKTENPSARSIHGGRRRRRRRPGLAACAAAKRRRAAETQGSGVPPARRHRGDRGALRRGHPRAVRGHVHSHIKRVHHLRPSTRVRRPRPGFTGSFLTRSVKISRK